MIVRSVHDMEGVKAWQRLFKKYNPRTMARGLRLLTETVNPSKVKDLTEIEAGITKWEEKCKMLAGQFGEKISDRMAMAILTNMMPSSIQDYMYTHADMDPKYEELKEKVRAMVSNKIANNMGPAPMDVGGVGGHHDHVNGLRVRTLR